MMTGDPATEATAGELPPGSLDDALHEVENRVLRDRVSAETSTAGAFAFAQPVPGARGTRGRRAVMAIARTGAPFESAQREALRYLAGQVAVALENIELHELVSDEPVPAP